MGLDHLLKKSMSVPSMRVGNGYFAELDKLRALSQEKQLEIESEDKVSFDQFLDEYFSSDT